MFAGSDCHLFGYFVSTRLALEDGFYLVVLLYSSRGLLARNINKAFQGYWGGARVYATERKLWILIWRES